MKAVTKAIFPVAGLGSRFLPATKASPKEMLTIIDKPLIQYAVEEAVASGITDLIFITSSNKRAVEDHFDQNLALEMKLEKAQKFELLKQVQTILPKGVHCTYIRQPDSLGLGHAVLCAEHIINNEPVAIILADDVIMEHQQPCLAELIETYQEKQASVISVQEVSDADVEKYGIVAVAANGSRASQVVSIVEKPKISEAPSNLAIIGRYVLTPQIFQCLAKTQADLHGELQLTHAIETLLNYEKVYAQRISGTRFDCGSKLGMLQATVNFALQHPAFGKEFRRYLTQLIE